MFDLFGLLQEHNVRLVDVQHLSFPCHLTGEFGRTERQRNSIRIQKKKTIIYSTRSFNQLNVCKSYLAAKYVKIYWGVSSKNMLFAINWSNLDAKKIKRLIKKYLIIGPHCPIF